MRYTVEAKRTIDAAIKLADKLGHSYLGTDHLAVALLSFGSTEAAAALKRLRVRIVELRNTLVGELPAGQTARAVKRRPITPRVAKVLQRAARLAQARDSGPIGTEDLLIALLQTEGPTRERIASAIIQAVNRSAYSHCVAADVLRSVGQVFRDRETYPSAENA